MSISYDMDELLREMDAIKEETVTLQMPSTIFRLCVCVSGILGNLFAIFLIFGLAEYKKNATHWYVLQLTIANLIYLPTIPFHIMEDIENGWKFSIWMCKAKETILFLSYYSSTSFLLVMSIDCYTAVCHKFSSRMRKLRTPLATGIITVAVWLICLFICIPITIYSTPRGEEPNCRCEFQFPKSDNPNKICLHERETEGTAAYDACVKEFTEFSQEACISLSTVLSSGFGTNFYIDNPNEITSNDSLEFAETTASPDEDDVTSETLVIFQPGCHYFDFAYGFKVFTLFNFVGFLIPLIIISVCYVLIVHQLREGRLRAKRQDSRRESKSRHGYLSSTGGKYIKSISSTKNKNRFRNTIICGATSTIFLVCWLPYHSVQLARLIGIQQSSQYCINLLSTVSLIALANTAVNPYVYSFVVILFRTCLSSASSAVPVPKHEPFNPEPSNITTRNELQEMKRLTAEQEL